MISCWGDEEDEALEGLTPEAQVIYLRVLRRYMDSATGVVGVVRRISKADLAAAIRVQPDFGSNKCPAAPSRQFLRSRLEELKRAGLAAPIAGPPGAKGFFFSLPKATTHPSVQKRNNPRTTRRTTQEQPMIASNNQDLTDESGQRNNQPKQKGATLYLASKKCLKNSPLPGSLSHNNIVSPTTTAARGRGRAEDDRFGKNSGKNAGSDADPTAGSGPEGATHGGAAGPAGIDPAAWRAYLDHRRAQGSALTPRDQSRARARLAQLAALGHPPNAVLRQSVAQGWRGLFPLSPPAPPRRSPREKFDPLEYVLRDRHAVAAGECAPPGRGRTFEPDE